MDSSKFNSNTNTHTSSHTKDGERERKMKTMERDGHIPGERHDRSTCKNPKGEHTKASPASNETKYILINTKGN